MRNALSVLASALLGGWVALSRATELAGSGANSVPATGCSQWFHDK